MVPPLVPPMVLAAPCGFYYIVVQAFRLLTLLEIQKLNVTICAKNTTQKLATLKEQVNRGQIISRAK